MKRQVDKIVAAVATPEGDGVTVYRSIGKRGLMNLDPFLLLDEVMQPESKNMAGFPEHPHRGFETVTYMLSGRVAHRDTAGNEGEIGPGDVQWMTAGRGIIHSEMPVASGEDARGFQLWVNLPPEDKMMAPRYQEVKAATIPTVSGHGYTAKLIAGSLDGKTEGPVTGITVKPLYADVTLTDSQATFKVKAEHTVFLYGVTGQGSIAGKPFTEKDLVILTDGTEVTVDGTPGTRFLMVAGAPTNAPIARYGPFVMNTHEEIMQTLDDWNNGRFLS